MASQYSRGRDTEYKCIEELTKQGYRCTRAASSKGNWDVIAINEDRVILVSCKRAKNERLAQRHLTKERGRLQLIRTPASCEQQLWVWLDGVGWFCKAAIDENSLGAVLGQIYSPRFEALRDVPIARYATVLRDEIKAANETTEDDRARLLSFSTNITPD